MAQRLIVSETVVDVLLPATVGTACRLDLRLSGTTVPGRYELAKDFAAQFTCDGDPDPGIATSGEVIVAKVGATWSGYFKLEVVSTARVFDIEGWFIDASA